ncbi:MAG: 2-hydroxyacyl-CoA dehydratase family protein [Bifidobacteriaceae bacterium]|jgi:benzoyl-CoA reductase/2-hydroxyglutaryl-CoA dehydratase subunit BcrC/BadD/HgdB|nr:2-hydroxyacyl-CoA dehydratase family protein [Bifidobacteriaceae bacterium]
MTTSEEPTEVPAKIRLREIAAGAYQAAWDAKARGEKIGWCASNFPQEIPETLGVAVVYPENQAAAIAAKGGGLEACEHAEGMGYCADLCAYARINFAFADLKSSPFQDMPQPDFVLCCNNICNTMISWYENLAHELDIPMILIDVPFTTGDKAGPETITYMRTQFDEAFTQLSAITGKAFDPERFREVMAISQRTAKAWLKAAGYSRYRPSPFSGFDLFNHMAVAVCARGKIEAAEAFEALCAEFEELAAQGASGFRGEERHRILFEGIACWPHLRATYSALKDLGINVVSTVYAAAFGITYDSLDQMMEAYAHVPNSISLDRAANLRIDSGRQAGIDGAVIHTNRSCKLWSGMMPEIERRLRAALEVPTVTFDGDQADPRVFSEAQYLTRVQGLAEIMDQPTPDGKEAS